MVQVTNELPSWAQLLTITNTVLVGVVVYLLTESWKRINYRVDRLEDTNVDIRERISSLEAFTRGWDHPHRRRTDSGPQPVEEGA